MRQIELCYIYRMANQPVDFNPGERDYLRPAGRPQGLVGLVMRLSGGRIKSENFANLILFVVALVIFAAAIAIFFAGR